MAPSAIINHNGLPISFTELHSADSWEEVCKSIGFESDLAHLPTTMMIPWLAVRQIETPAYNIPKKGPLSRARLIYNATRILSPTLPIADLNDEKYTECYFRYFDHSLPVYHHSSFHISDVSDTDKLAVMTIGALYAGNHEQALGRGGLQVYCWKRTRSSVGDAVEFATPRSVGPLECCGRVL